MTPTEWDRVMYPRGRVEETRIPDREPVYRCQWLGCLALVAEGSARPVGRDYRCPLCGGHLLRWTARVRQQRPERVAGARM